MSLPAFLVCPQCSGRDLWQYQKQFCSNSGEKENFWWILEALVHFGMIVLLCIMYTSVQKHGILNL